MEWLPWILAYDRKTESEQKIALLPPTFLKG